MELTPLRRASAGAVLGGVCAGLARRWQVDPTVLRIAMVLLALIGGLGVAFYVGALLLIPRDGSSDLPLHRIVPFTRSWSPAASIGAVVGLGVLITVLIGSWLPFGIAPAVGLAFLWYFGFYRRRSHTSGQSPSTPAQLTAAPPPPPRTTESMTDFERAAAEWQQRVAQERWARTTRPPAELGESSHRSPSAVGVDPALADNEATTESTAASTVPLTNPEPDEPPRLYEYAPTPPQVPARVPQWTPPASRPRRPRPPWVWPLVLCLVGAGLATLAGLSTVFGLAVPPVAYAGTVLGALGLGLIIAAFAGRPRGLLPIGVLAGLVTVVMLLPTPTVGSVGDDTYTYTTMTQLPPEQGHGAGDVTLDLTGLAITGDGRYEFHSGVGDVLVKLPATGNVIVEWKTGMGEYHGPDGNQDGLGLQGSYRRVTDASLSTLTVVVRTGAGDVRVQG